MGLNRVGHRLELEEHHPCMEPMLRRATRLPKLRYECPSWFAHNGSGIGRDDVPCLSGPCILLPTNEQLELKRSPSMVDQNPDRKVGGPRYCCLRVLRAV